MLAPQMAPVPSAPAAAAATWASQVTLQGLRETPNSAGCFATCICAAGIGFRVTIGRAHFLNDIILHTVLLVQLLCLLQQGVNLALEDVWGCYKGHC